MQIKRIPPYIFLGISSICWGVSYWYSKLADAKDNGGLGGLMETIDAILYGVLGLVFFLVGFCLVFLFQIQTQVHFMDLEFYPVLVVLYCVAVMGRGLFHDPLVG